MNRLLQTLGIVLVLGGLGHSIGIVHLYVTRGVPDMNRVLLDVWIAEAQLLGGGLYLAAFGASRAGADWRVLGCFGAFTVIGYTGAFVPVLFLRAPWIFRVPATVYLIASVVILISAVRSVSKTS